jgi:hypothetical protein
MLVLAAAGCGDAGTGTQAVTGAPVPGVGPSVAAPAAGIAGSGAALPSAAAAGTPAAVGGKAGAPAAVSAGSAAMTMTMTMAPKIDPNAVVRGTGPATFTRVWNEILMPKGCAGAYCHGSGQGGLKFMKKEEAYTTLVGAMAAGPACGTSGKVRVKAGEPDASLLLEKMSMEKPSCGDAMPIGTKLEPSCVSMNTSVCNTIEDLKLVREWIAAGAKND